MQILELLAFLLALQYGVGFVVLLVQHRAPPLSLRPARPEEISADALAFLEGESRKLEACGFERRALGMVGSQFGGCFAYLVHPERGDTALVARMGPARWTDLNTRFVGGPVVNTSNIADPGVYARHPRYLDARLPHVTDVRTLYELHTLRRVAAVPHARRVDVPDPGMEIAVLNQQVNEHQPLQVQAGTLRPAGDGFRLTARGAAIAVWRQSATSKWLCAWLLRRRGIALEAALRRGAGGPAAALARG